MYKRSVARNFFILDIKNIHEWIEKCSVTRVINKLKYLTTAVQFAKKLARIACCIVNGDEDDGRCRQRQRRRRDGTLGGSDDSSGNDDSDERVMGMTR